MTFNSLKKIVQVAITKEIFTSTNTKVIASVLLYKALNQIINLKPETQGEIKSLADSYCTTYKSISESLEKKYLSYKKMKRIIEDEKITNIINMSISQINKIYELYLNKSEIAEFSTFSFSQNMYNTFGLNDVEINKLNSIHFKVMVPIIKYYEVYYDIKMKDVFVEDCGKRPASEFLFSINGLSNAQVLSDIERDVFLVKKYIHSIDFTPDGYLKLILK